MTRDDIAFMLARREVGGQHLQRRCFVASSFRNRDLVAGVVERLRAAGWFAYDFTVAEFSLSEKDWGGLTYAQARTHPEIASAAQSDLAMLRCLGASDVLLVVLPAGVSAGWEAGFAAARGARVVVCGDLTQLDVPVLHADQICATADEALAYISDPGGGIEAE